MFDCVLCVKFAHLYFVLARCFDLTKKPTNETLPKALRTQGLTALTSNFGLVGLVQYIW